MAPSHSPQEPKLSNVLTAAWKALIKFFERNQVCDFNLWYQGLVGFQIQYGLRTTTGGGRDGGAGIRCQIRSFMARTNSGPREHLDYDQIDFKIRSKTVKEHAKLKSNGSIFWEFKLLILSLRENVEIFNVFEAIGAKELSSEQWCQMKGEVSGMLWIQNVKIKLSW